MIPSCDNLSSKEWNEALAEFPATMQDVYFTPDYHELHEEEGWVAKHCFNFSEEDKGLLVPGLRTAIPSDLCKTLPGGFYDLQTCNGYGGPLARGKVEFAFLDRSWAEWRRSSANRGIVASFFRLHPLLNNTSCLPPDARILNDRKTIFVDLTVGLETVWKNANSQFRNRVNKSRREGLEIQWNNTSDWEGFPSFYAKAMERLNAPEGLRFSPGYFTQLQNLDGAQISSARHGTDLAAAVIWLFGPRWGHCHLAARHPQADSHFMYSLYQAGLEKAAELGLKGVHFGGGRTSASDDPLLRFKKRVGGSLLDFKVALVISDSKAFDQLCRCWADETGERPRWLLGYRQPKTIRRDT